MISMRLANVSLSCQVTAWHDSRGPRLYIANYDGLFENRASYTLPMSATLMRRLETDGDDGALLAEWITTALEERLVLELFMDCRPLHRRQR